MVYELALPDLTTFPGRLKRPFQVKQAPLRLLICSYGIAAAAAVALHMHGLDPISSALVFWFGGAVLTIVLAVTPYVREFFIRDGDGRF